MKIVAICICLSLTILSNNCFAQSCSDWIVRAEGFKIEGNYESAIIEYNKAIKDEPTNAEYYYRRGLTYVSIRKYSLAIQDFDTVIHLRPKYYEGYGASASVYAILQYRGKAMQKYDSMCLIKNCPDTYKSSVKAKILSSLQEKEFEKLTSQYTEYFLLFLKIF
jgi:tetratricopeptide (TPR) repeat protein